MFLHESMLSSKSSRTKKARRKKHNLASKCRIQAIISRAKKVGVEVILVNPAFTSMLGKVKYQNLYSLSEHTAAALVIARRGLGIKERAMVTESDSGRQRWNLEGRSLSLSLSRKQYSWLSIMIRQLKPATLTGSELTPRYEENQETDTAVGVAPSLGEVPRGESIPITGRYRQAKTCRSKKCDLVNFFQVN